MMQSVEPIPNAFTYVAWNMDLHTVGPFVRDSSIRKTALAAVKAIARELDATPGVHRVRLFESTFIPPLSDRPRFDVILLIDSEQSVRDAVEIARVSHDVATPDLVTGAVNVARFGDTDNSDGPVLLNHFLGDASPQTALDTITSISRWYGSVLRVTNATLLQFDSGAPFLVTNYVVVPGSVVRFMANQLLRPSFYVNVTRPLTRVGMAARPLFAQRVDHRA